jgi:hypothetical protein
MKNEYRAMRQKAIQRYLAGEKAVHIYRDLGMSRRWLYKCLHRHNPEDAYGDCDMSPEPARHLSESSVLLQRLS